jgi:rhodanese-related sulfurtransferase
MQPRIFEISAVEAHRRGRAGEALLLDVREDDEWAAGHAEEAVHAPLSRLDPATVPTELPVVAVCRVGSRSAMAAGALAARGVQVVNMSGGMLAWEAVGLPVVRGKGEPGEVL